MLLWEQVVITLQASTHFYKPAGDSGLSSDRPSDDLWEATTQSLIIL